MVLDPRSEKNILTLVPHAQVLARRFMEVAVPFAWENGAAQVVITSGTRTYAEQDKLFRQRPKVTNARSGQSNHNFGIAWDITLFKPAGKPLWESPMYEWIGENNKIVALGLEWGGNWKSISDRPHYQCKIGKSVKELDGLVQRHGEKTALEMVDRMVKEAYGL